MPEVSVLSLPARFHRQVEHARTALERGNMEYTVNICRGILFEHPGCLPVRRLLRAAQMKLFRQKNPFVAQSVGLAVAVPCLAYGHAVLKKTPVRAMSAAEVILTRDPTNTAALVLLARAARAHDLPETAAFAFEAVVEARPDDRAAIIELADAYIAAGRTSEAVAIADRLLRESPADFGLQDLAKRASVAQSIAAGRWDSASGTYRDKLRDEELAVTIEQAGKAVNSEEMIRRLVDDAVARVEIEPGNLNHYRTIVKGYRSLGEFDAALEWTRRARALPVGSVDASLEKTEGDLRIAKLDREARDRRAVVISEGGDPERDEELTRLYLQLTRLRIDTLRALTEKYPNDFAYKHDLGRLLQITGQTDAAIQQFQLAQRSPKLRLQAVVALGECFKTKRLFDLAVQQFELAKRELLLFDDEKKEVTYHLATCYEAMGKTEQALEEYKSIYSADIAFRDVASKIDGYYARR